MKTSISRVPAKAPINCRQLSKGASVETGLERGETVFFLCFYYVGWDMFRASSVLLHIIIGVKMTL